MVFFSFNKYVNIILIVGDYMKNGFTLVELLVVVIIIALTTVLVITKVEKNIKRAKELEKQTQIEAIENAAYIYMQMTMEKNYHA